MKTIDCPQCGCPARLTGRVLRPHRREGNVRCRFGGGTIDDARTGLSPTARATITRRLAFEKAAKESELTHAAVAATVGRSFTGLLDPEHEDDDEFVTSTVGDARQPEIDWSQVPNTERPLPFRPAPVTEGLSAAGWPDHAVEWETWECDCPKPTGHYWAPGRAVEEWDGEGFRPMSWRTPGGTWHDLRIADNVVILGHSEDLFGNVFGLREACPTWRRVRRSAVLNPRRRASVPDEAGTAPEDGAQPVPEPIPPEPFRLVTNAADLDAVSARALFPAAVKTTVVGRGVTASVQMVGFARRERDGGRRVPWWAYWNGSRFERAFWEGWPCNLGELKQLLAGKLAEPKKLDPDVKKIKKKAVPKKAARTRKGWVPT